MAASLPYPAMPYLNLNELVMTLMLASLLSWTADSNISNCCFLSTRNYSIRDMRLGLDSTLLPFYAVNSATSHFNNFRTFYSRLSIYAFLLWRVFLALCLAFSFLLSVSGNSNLKSSLSKYFFLIFFSDIININQTFHSRAMYSRETRKVVTVRFSVSIVGSVLQKSSTYTIFPNLFWNSLNNIK